MLVPTSEATARAEDIQNLDRGIGQRGSRQFYLSMERMRRIRTRIYAVLLGMRASAAASTNWPSEAVANYSTLLKCQDPNENSKWGYRRELPTDKDGEYL